MSKFGTGGSVRFRMDCRVAVYGELGAEIEPSVLTGAFPAETDGPTCGPRGPEASPNEDRGGRSIGGSFAATSSETLAVFLRNTSNYLSLLKCFPRA